MHKKLIKYHNYIAKNMRNFSIIITGVKGTKALMKHGADLQGKREGAAIGTAKIGTAHLTSSRLSFALFSTTYARVGHPASRAQYFI